MTWFVVPPAPPLDVRTAAVALVVSFPKTKMPNCALPALPPIADSFAEPTTLPVIPLVVPNRPPNTVETVPLAILATPEIMHDSVPDALFCLPPPIKLKSPDAVFPAPFTPPPPIKDEIPVA